MKPERGALAVLGIAGVFAVLRHAARENKREAAVAISKHKEHAQRSKVDAEMVRTVARKRQQRVADAGMQLQLQRRGIFAAGTGTDDPAMSQYVAEAARGRWP